MNTLIAPPVAPTIAKTPVRMSYEEWLQWDYEGGLTEWVNGEVIFHRAVILLHQDVALFIASLIKTFATLHNLGYTGTAPAAMRIKPEGSGREPDVFFVARAHAKRLIEGHLEGPADLVVEVISDESVSRDRDDKYYEYEEGGVREYWVIDPRPHRQRTYFYVLNDKGRYQPVSVGDDGIYHSTVLPGFWLNVAWLWSGERNELAALTAIIGADKLIEAIRSVS